MDYYQFLFPALPEHKKDMLVALLNNIGFMGFEEEPDHLKAFIEIEGYSQEEFEKIINKVSAKYERSSFPGINWNEKWEAGFEPVTILHPDRNIPFVHIRAGFHNPLMEATYDIEITPKMSFGTGHHATTYLMVEQMCRMDLENKTVIDFGTGTAVLSIVAEKMGASSVLAIDNDDWSISNAKENIAANNCSKISLFKNSTINAGAQASIILANINLNIIINNLASIAHALERDGTLICSGILQQDEHTLLNSIKQYAFKIENLFYKDGWMLISAKK